MDKILKIKGKFYNIIGKIYLIITMKENLKVNLIKNKINWTHHL
jgi:hypothetical protein